MLHHELERIIEGIVADNLTFLGTKVDSDLPPWGPRNDLLLPLVTEALAIEREA